MSLFKRRSLRPVLLACAAVASSILFYAAFILRPWHLRLLPFTLRPTNSLPMTTYPATCVTMADAAKNRQVNDTICVAPTSGILATPTHIATLSEWSFDKSRDTRDYSLTADQCNIAFPGLYAEIERAVAYRKKIGRLSPEDVDISWSKEGLVRALISDQQLYVIEEKVSGSDYDSPRALAILHAIHRAMITSPAPLPEIEFSFSVSDIADEHHLGRSIWALARTASEQEKWLMSDFGYWSWPLDLVGGYDQIRREIADIEVAFSEKKPQVVWRGAVKTNKFRQDLIRVTNEKIWADVKGILWKDATDLRAQDYGKANSIPEHCLYQFLIQTEGHSYSGRGKYLQNCNSVVIIPKRTWIEPHHSLLRSGHNFVEVEEDFSNLEETMVSLLADPAKAQQIAINSTETFRDRYLTPAAQACYWRRLITSWAEVSFVPTLWEVGVDGGHRRVRGIPFETFVIQSLTQKKNGCSWFRKLLLQC
ncbi:hypothetical protein ONS95_014440 [Cadophora gregata]|uniref:uncharacterized protein n=1 Tax=Cadophora gregata TaxID=51156 RepID=UPI0026DB6155|nr:uncharacterized protein ONS95_014440 [Cadophora gregata]KAK0112703.1 hypothetical protein ONS95_014440 [Cadophora gregata]